MSQERGGILEVDLHGQQVAAALEVWWGTGARACAAPVLSRARVQLVAVTISQNRGKQRRIRFITGVGKHSRGGTGVLLPAVQKFLKEECCLFVTLGRDNRRGTLLVRV